MREEVPAAVSRCLHAGIAVKIVTGDTAVTATEIARKIGLWSDDDGERSRMTGAEFASASDEELLERVADLKILSRPGRWTSSGWCASCSGAARWWP